jgi:hypothetical protein
MPTATSFQWSIQWTILVGLFNAFMGMMNVPIAIAGALALAFGFHYFLFGSNRSRGQRGGGSVFGSMLGGNGLGRSKRGAISGLEYDANWITVNQAHELYGVSKSTLRSNALRGWFGFPSGIQQPVMNRGKWIFMEYPHYHNWHEKRNMAHHEID